MILRLVLAVISLLLGTWLRRRREHFRYFQHLGIPGPKPNVIFGNLLEVYLKNSLWAVNDWHRKFGPVVGLFYGKEPLLLVADPELAQRVLSDSTVFTDRSHIFNYSGVPNSVACLKGDEWRQLRSLLSKYYVNEGVNKMNTEMNNCVDDLLKNVSKESTKGSREFDILPLYEAFSLDLICSTSCGLKYNIQKHQQNLLLNHVLQRPLLGIYEILKISLPNLDGVYCQLQTVFRKMLAKAANSNSSIENLQLDCQNKVSALRKTNKTNFDLLTLMVAEGYNITEKQIVDSCILNVLAGFDPTSSALSFITNMLIRYSEVQDRLRAELKQAKLDPRKIEASQLNQCRYLDAVIKETLRMYPPVFMFTSRVSGTGFKFGEIDIPKGLTVMVSTRELHYTEELYSEPERFDPTRFLGNSETTWLPFGGGARSCLGMNYSMQALKLSIARLLLNFKLDNFDYLPQSRVELQANPGILRLKNGLRCRALTIK